jgi:hypothetical protein
LAESDREKIFKTLRTVRIHIVDPRPYMVDVQDSLQKHLPNGITVPDFLKRLDASTKHLRQTRRLALECIATSILHDAPAERLKTEYQAWEYASGMTIHVDESLYSEMPLQPVVKPQRTYDLAPFEHEKSNILNDVANFVSASASIFWPALDEFRDARQDYFLDAPMAGPWLISSALGRSHAFDQGHSHAVRWIEKQRTDALAQIDPRGLFYPRNMPRPILELVSTESVPIQAADIAAGIARELWCRNSLPHLVNRFEYVTFNGDRLSDIQAQQYEAIIRNLSSSN